MKKLLAIFLVTAFLGIPLVAQEETAQEAAAPQETTQQTQDPRAAMAAAAAAEGIIMPGEVTTQMEKITVNGMIVTGAQARLVDNTAIDNDDEDDWKLMGWDTTWQRNSALMSLTYNNGKYGGYINMRAED
jgi:zona occludens toxin (predicted ATPase)